MTNYYRPVPRDDAHRTASAHGLAGGWLWFDTVEVLRRDAAPRLMAADRLPDEVLARLSAPRAPLAGLDWSAPRLMGILNVTPDSFSDGGRHFDRSAALDHASRLIEGGGDILDIGGESTRPGAAEVAVAQERDRTEPVIRALRERFAEVPISIDTRKAPVAKAALAAGATILNDVSALSFDPDMAALAAEAQAPICLMHAQGDPQTMQKAPRYDDVVLDVFDYLAQRVDHAVAAGVDRSRIIVDPGIGFGKTQAHNLALLRNLSLFHALGCVILLGASRKRFIGTIGGADVAADRVPGSLAVALHGARQGVQILRVHDMIETRQALALWRAVQG
ncbi:dihydropteroate synthase [Brevirhabdus sp.]|uniref:dihydropteroate synthase n=1 Tax=Brevirhabdus sp. TaxID=2004514 RepID=UPI0040589C4B